MAEFSVHISQAQHNESLATHLLDKPYCDWIITACFYAAIHYFEARLFLEYANDSDKHTDTSVPVDEMGYLQYSPHAWRTDLVRRISSKQAWKDYRKLKTASELARYLASSPRTSNAFLTEPSYCHFSNEIAKQFVERLQTLKDGFNIGIAELLHELDVGKRTNLLNAAFIINKVLTNFSSPEDVLQGGKQALLKYLSTSQIDVLQECLQAKGYDLT